MFFVKTILEFIIIIIIIGPTNKELNPGLTLVLQLSKWEYFLLTNKIIILLLGLNYILGPIEKNPSD